MKPIPPTTKPPGKRELPVRLQLRHPPFLRTDEVPVDIVQLLRGGKYYQMQQPSWLHPLNYGNACYRAWALAAHFGNHVGLNLPAALPCAAGGLPDQPGHMRDWSTVGGGVGFGAYFAKRRIETAWWSGSRCAAFCIHRHCCYARQCYCQEAACAKRG